MKYQGAHESARGIEVYDFVLGKEEIRVIRDCLKHTYANVPESIETLIYRRRIRTILKEIEGSKILRIVTSPK